MPSARLAPPALPADAAGSGIKVLVADTRRSGSGARNFGAARIRARIARPWLIRNASPGGKLRTRLGSTFQRLRRLADPSPVGPSDEKRLLYSIVSCVPANTTISSGVFTR
jgi:hypothetical protein